MKSHLRNWKHGVVAFDSGFPPSIIVSGSESFKPDKQLAEAIRAAMPPPIADSVLIGLNLNLLVVRLQDTENVARHIEELVKLLNKLV